MGILEDAFIGAKGTIRFTPRPDPIPGDLRLSWRLSALVLVLERSRGKTASLEQIHFLTSAMRSDKVARVAIRWFRGARAPDDPVIRYDPSMSRTIGLAIASGLADWKGPSVTLTDDGLMLAASIRSNESVLRREKEFLSKLPKVISQKSIREMLEV
ncbi:hypothetical protein OG767_03355 [Micromonospora sp. NBC_01392]|uniref:hypothetical protein n=1 Tax=Micromonospora sp. NBC_01392 TaxID=2903588 RepID=UPI0032468D2B